MPSSRDGMPLAAQRAIQASADITSLRKIHGGWPGHLTHTKYGALAQLDAMFWASERATGTERSDLAGDEPIEEYPNGGPVSLDARLRSVGIIIYRRRHD